MNEAKYKNLCTTITHITHRRKYDDIEAAAFLPTKTWAGKCEVFLTEYPSFIGYNTPVMEWITSGICAGCSATQALHQWRPGHSVGYPTAL